MIEIKQGWNGKEAGDQHDRQMLDCKITSLNKQLSAALEMRVKIQEKCEHKHVLFAGQEMTCDVCGLRLEK